MINPKLLCNKHLLGEHVELHMLVGSILKNKSLEGFKKNNLIEVHNINKRHQELVKEMIRRGMNHNSELPKFKSFKYGKVNIQNNLKELKQRCNKCKINE